MMLHKCFVWRRIRSEGTESCSEKFVTAWLNDFEIGDVGFRIIESLLKVRFQKLRERTDSRIRLRVMRQSSRLHALIYLKCPQTFEKLGATCKMNRKSKLVSMLPVREIVELELSFSIIVSSSSSSSFSLATIRRWTNERVNYRGERINSSLNLNFFDLARVV